MVRWEPGARERLQEAALALYASKGFEETTVSEIAQSVGLTERTFFRYFADKREVIFGGQDVFERAFVDGVAAAPADLGSLAIVTAAVTSAAGFFPESRRTHSRQRYAVITANAGLQERELLKMAALAAAVARALRARGVPEPAATLSAETGVTVFRVSYEQWIADDGGDRPLLEIERDVFAELGVLVSATA